MNSQSKPIITSQDLSSAALSYTTSIGRRFKLDSIRFHSSVAITETITITRISASGVNYSEVIASIDLVSNQSYIFRPQGEENFYAGEEVKIQCTNANTTGTIYATIKPSSHLQ